ncbi:VOC family protein [Stackebrandtia nassauensis]|uniref:Glyoxalase/bleomycin resistance protein/dioxygenase n=1 Tax=Stackebrandtia nassauensis (strain DSM 44728 / CIP 108903 / NRRL B-16338 / NBRC 102104 / LLR-40K-21) TaxID=446470 RepID=D3PWJ1_STANL|nr:VOC family protein [Stackebrandtia nassauensis]ADD43213.1 Glyoxalase/bleomycin resistance protein/dioxygenase [Stackebrandtia nassauensis DSM 44728]
MSVNLFSGFAVRDLSAAVAWYEKLLGAAPSFYPNDVEAVWELAENRFVYVIVRPEDAGHGVHTIVVGDYDERLVQIAGRGLKPDEVEDYGNGVRKAIFHDPDGNEFGIGGLP